MSDRITAAQAREISGPSDEQNIAAAIDEAMAEIKSAAKRKLHSARLHSTFWVRGGYNRKKGDLYSRACAELRELGYKVSYFYEEHQLVDAYTVVEW